MKILSVTNKKTQLHKSPSDLGVICTQEYNQKRSISTDVSFVQPGPNLFVQIFKNSDIVELWRIKNKNGTDVFDRIKKVKISGIQAIAGGKSTESTPEYAVGYTTGQISVADVSNQKFKFEFPPDPTKASVISLDYSNCGGYLSSVYENGLINIFGLKTKIKSDTILLDKDSSLARFHPAKRFHLAVASFKGTVTIYDIASKKIAFQEKQAHDAPCRDMAMCEDLPDRLLTCGCDSVIKIFDTRKKGSGLQIQSHCGLSTISVSKCGAFFAVGNLKGDLIAYDMRSLRQPLSKAKLDNELVTRISFLPTWGDSVDSFPTMSQRDSTESTASDELPEPPEVQNDFTMDDIINFPKGRISDFDMNVSSRVSAIRPSEVHRNSDAYLKQIALAMNDLSFTGSDTNSPTRSISEKVNTFSHFDPVTKRKRESLPKRESLSKRRSSFMPPLQRIHEEQNHDKENQSISLNSPDYFTAPRFSSTPAPPVKSPESESEVIDVDADETSILRGDKQSIATVTPNSQQYFDMKKEFDTLQENLNKKIEFEVKSLSYDLSQRHIELMTNAASQRRALQNQINVIENCMGILMNDDVKINRIMELQDENQQLRQQLNNVLRQIQM